jgi:hypothetical protein
MQYYIVTRWKKSEDALEDGNVSSIASELSNKVSTATTDERVSYRPELGETVELNDEGERRTT